MNKPIFSHRCNEKMLLQHSFLFYLQLQQQIITTKFIFHSYLAFQLILLFWFEVDPHAISYEKPQFRREYERQLFLMLLILSLQVTNIVHSRANPFDSLYKHIQMWHDNCQFSLRDSLGSHAVLTLLVTQTKIISVIVKNS